MLSSAKCSAVDGFWDEKKNKKKIDKHTFIVIITFINWSPLEKSNWCMRANARIIIIIRHKKCRCGIASWVAREKACDFDFQSNVIPIPMNSNQRTVYLIVIHNYMASVNLHKHKYKQYVEGSLTVLNVPKMVAGFGIFMCPILSEMWTLAYIFRVIN